MADRLRDLNKAWRTFRKSQANETSASVGPGGSGESDVNIGVTASYTIDPLVPYLGALLLESGVARPNIVCANYNQIVRTCLDPASEFGSQRLDAIVVFWRIEDIAAPQDSVQALESCQMMLSAVTQLRTQFAGTIILALPPRPRAHTEGIAEYSRVPALTLVWHRVLTEVSRMTKEFQGLYSIDLEAVIAAHGQPAALDHRKELLYRQPYTDVFHASCAEAVVRILRARRTEPKKCLVLDCDNTLWGGVIGEDGLGGIQLGEDFPGNAYRRLQEQIVVLRRSGVFIALNSKNNPDDVWEMFDTHDGMALKREDISVSKVNWRPKSENLKEIARELNIGLDSLVFLDDSHFEVEEVRAHAPEVTVVQVPEEVADIPQFMRSVARHFDRLDITADDRTRVNMMQQEIERRDLAQKMTEADFLATLGLEVYLYTPTDTDLARVTQLINKTNQFNVTTRRYLPEDVAGFVAASDCDIYCASVRDRFGDYGLIGVAIVRHGNTNSVFDTLLMSCRVLGRGIETTMIAHGLDLARGRGNAELAGHYIPTRKNAMVADLYERHGFVASAGGCSRDIETTWLRATSPLVIPAFLSVREQHP